MSSQYGLLKTYMGSQKNTMIKAGIIVLLVAGGVSLIILSKDRWLGFGIFLMALYIDSNIDYRFGGD